MSAKHPNVIESAISQFRSVLVIPAMEHRVFSVLTIAVVAGVALLVVLYGLSAVLMLIAGYLPD